MSKSALLDAPAIHICALPLQGRTPVCTTELGYMAKIKPEFDKRGVKIIGLSVDPVEKHSGWAADIKETQGFAPNYPMIGDTNFNVSKLYGMLPATVSGDPAKRTAADTIGLASAVSPRALAVSRKTFSAPAARNCFTCASAQKGLMRLARSSARGL